MVYFLHALFNDLYMILSVQLIHVGFHCGQVERGILQSGCLFICLGWHPCPYCNIHNFPFCLKLFPYWWLTARSNSTLCHFSGEGKTVLCFLINEIFSKCEIYGNTMELQHLCLVSVKILRARLQLLHILHDNSGFTVVLQYTRIAKLRIIRTLSEFIEWYLVGRCFSRVFYQNLQ